MNQSMPLAFSQHKEVLSALSSNYSSLDDVDRVIKVGELQKDLVGICQQREASVADSVKGVALAPLHTASAPKKYAHKASAHAALQQGVRTAELEATPLEPEAAHEERVVALQTSLAHSREQVEALEQEGKRVRCTSWIHASQTSLSYGVYSPVIWHHRVVPLMHAAEFGEVWTSRRSAAT